MAIQMKNRLIILTTLITILFQTNTSIAAEGEDRKPKLLLTEITANPIEGNKYSTEIKVIPNEEGFITKPFSLEDLLFTDDGTGYDREAGDGIYTSTSLRTFANGIPASLTKDWNVYVTPDGMPSDKVGGSVSLGCKMRWVTCNPPTVTCPNCTYLGGDCIEWYDCEVTVTLGF